MSNQTQVFQTVNQKRWQRIKWSLRVFLLLFPIAFAIIYIGFNVYEPSIQLEGKAIKKVLTGSVPYYRESKLGKSYRGFRKVIDTKWAKGKGCGQSNQQINLSTSSLFNDSIGIRAAFYVNWDKKNSFQSLEKNINKLNLIMPEWIFINPETDNVYLNIDYKALALMKAAGVKIMPILSNNYKEIFRGESVRRILNNPIKKEKLINDVLKILRENNFAGINIDFEELNLNDNQQLVLFQKELYNKLNAEHFLVSQDIIPFNDDYNFKILQKYNDYLILMAYDEHNSSTKAGAIGAQKWVEAAVDKVLSQVPANKIILAMAAFGYDWKLKSKSEPQVMSFQEAIGNAKKYESSVYFDNSTYNLHYQYYNEDDDSLHEVHFTDAATIFNILRYATENELAGTTIWRLGSEDERMWKFYNQVMTINGLKEFDFKKLSKLEAGANPIYFGEGEILDIVETPKPGKVSLEFDNDALLISEESYDILPSTYAIKKFGDTKHKKIVLTFDDGPDPKYTKQILDTLSYYNVPATFFIVGYEAENNIPLVKRIFKEGHEIGNHTFTHPNMATVSKKRASLEMDATRLLIECITGHSTIMFRAPFNADSEPGVFEELEPIALSRAKNYITIGESIDPEDWQKSIQPNINSDTIFNRILKIYQERISKQNVDDTTGINGSIILLHDAGGDRNATVQAVGKIIRYFKSKGYSFTTVADLLGKKRNDVMPEVPKNSGYYLLQFNFYLAEIGYLGGQMFKSLFIVFLTLGAIRLIIMGILAFLQKKKEKKELLEIAIQSNQYPLVSIIVPAYNEEVNVIKSIENLLLCDYPNFEIIFIDDGSADKTFKIVENTFSSNNKVKIFTKENGGKASALNFGINISKAQYVVCIDADTKLTFNAVSLLMDHFLKTSHQVKKIGAVAGIVKVGNEINMLTKWQSIEYITSQNFDRKGFAFANAITVIPGAIGAFKKEAILKSGGFTTDTLAEDCDITIRILKAGFIIENEPKAIAFTEAPETIKQFLKQRNRWTFGVMQTFWKHRGLLFNTENKNLGYIALPDIFIFKYLIPFFMPLADVLMLIGLLTGNAHQIGYYYLVFMIVDTAIASIAFAFEKEKLLKLFWLIPQRLIYRWLMMVVLFQSLRKAVKGELQYWGVLKRTGNVKDVLTN